MTHTPTAYRHAASPEVEAACRRAIGCLASEADNDALMALLDLLPLPPAQVVAWLGGAVKSLSAGRPPSSLTLLTSRRIPEKGVITQTTESVRNDDVAAVAKLAGQDVNGLMVLLACTAAALMETDTGRTHRAQSAHPATTAEQNI